MPANTIDNSEVRIRRCACIVGSGSLFPVVCYFQFQLSALLVSAVGFAFAFVFVVVFVVVVVGGGGVELSREFMIPSS